MAYNTESRLSNYKGNSRAAFHCVTTHLQSVYGVIERGTDSGNDMSRYYYSNPHSYFFRIEIEEWLNESCNVVSGCRQPAVNGRKPQYARAMMPSQIPRSSTFFPQSPLPSNTTTPCRSHCSVALRGHRSSRNVDSPLSDLEIPQLLPSARSMAPHAPRRYPRAAPSPPPHPVPLPSSKSCAVVGRNKRREN